MDNIISLADPHGIASLAEAEGAAAAFARSAALLAEARDAEKPELRAKCLDLIEAASAKAKASLLTPEGLKTFLAASPTFLKIRETRTDAEAPTIQTRLAGLLAAIFGEAAPSERGALVLAILPEAPEFSVLCELFRLVEGNWTADQLERPPEETYFGTGTAAFRDALFARVRLAAKKGSLWTQGSPTAILWFWWACGEEQRVYAFIKESMDDGKALAALLDEVVYRVATPEEEYDVIPVRRWSKIIDFRQLEPKVVQLSMNAPSRDDRRKARRFLDAFANGKSELFR